MEKINSTKETRSVSLMNNTITKVENYITLNSGGSSAPFSWKLENMIISLNDMTTLTKRELSDYFTLDEACAICDMMNCVLTTTSISPKMVLYHKFNDSCAYDNIDVKWNLEKDTTLNKITELTEFQAYVITMFTVEFWSEEDSDEEMFDKIKRIFLIKD